MSLLDHKQKSHLHPQYLPIGLDFEFDGMDHNYMNVLIIHYCKLFVNRLQKSNQIKPIKKA